jgi:uncharacterized protein (DUF924 family)
MKTPDDILSFWLDQTDPKNWYISDPDFDTHVRNVFLRTWTGAMEGACGLWLTYPTGTLAYIILTDQLSRNMFRGTGQAFASDRQALAAAKVAIDRGWDLRIDEPARQFFYMPLMHSENLCDQDRCVRLMLTRLPEGRANHLLHAKAHREVIRRYGRFPTRNEALARTSRTCEETYLSEGGYGAVVAELQAQASPQGLAVSA